jgi:hypothetical protein
MQDDGNEMSLTMTVSDAPSVRRCGDCNLCCKLLPFPLIKKPAGMHCKYQRLGKGCTIYASRPSCCRLWSCRWLVDPECADLRRPDRVHYVIDLVPDIITANDSSGKTMRMPVVQIWVDPKHRDAHRDPQLRRYLERLAETEGMAALIRFNEREGFGLFAPCLASDGQWHEQPAELQ